VGGLSADTVYYFQAISTDDLGLTKASAVTAIKTQPKVVVPPPLPEWEITNFEGLAQTTSISMSWKTDAYATTGKLLWGTSAANLSNSVDKAGDIKSHGFLVEGLSPDTLYYFQAVNVDDHGQEKRSAVIAVRTLQRESEDPAPGDWNILGFDATTSATSSNVIWQTPGAVTKATLLIGLSADDLTHRSIDVPSFAQTHVITVNGLVPDTTYFMKVICVDSAGRTQESVVIMKRTKTQ
jgi:hypothetical protein